MIFIKISKKSIIQIVSIICMVLILGMGVFEAFRIIKFNNKFIEMNKKNVGLCKEIEKLNEEIKCKDKEIDKCEKWLKIKDDRIGELEEVVKGYEEKLKEYESKSVPEIDTSKKTYMDYRIISRNSKQGEIVYGDEAWTDEDGLRNNYRIIL